MIRNERQYRITKAQAETFRQSLSEIRKHTIEDNSAQAELRRKLQEAAISSQLSDLDDEIREYEALQNLTNDVLEVISLDELPLALVKARIAAGLTQKELALKLGLKEQQIQRYEANNYAGANLERVQAVIEALGIKVRKQLFKPELPVTIDVLFDRLREVGLEKEFVSQRLLSPALRSRSEREERDLEAESLVFNAAARLSKIFKWDLADFFSRRSLEVPLNAVAQARFKLPKSVSRDDVSAYTVYAHYLALLLLQATPDVVPKPIPSSWRHIRKQYLESYAEVNLANLIRFVWDLGIVILPLRDKAHFHGACWRVRGRNVIVIKQKTSSEARWIIDLLHEVWHAAQNPELLEHSLVESEGSELAPADRVEEQIATDFAADVVFGGKADQLAEQCAVACNKRIEWLKSAVQRVATQNGVRVDLLANYMAYRLSFEDQNWWGTASRLQLGNEDPWMTVRDFVVTRIDWSALSASDGTLLLQALQSEVQHDGR